MKYDKDMIMDFGALSYDNKRISIILEIKESVFANDPEFIEMYERGKVMAEYVIDKKLFDLANTGDIKALDKLELRKKIRSNV